MQKLSLLFEKGKDGRLWGCLEFEDNLIVDEANSVGTLKNNMKRLLKDFHDINPSSVYLAITSRELV